VSERSATPDGSFFTPENVRGFIGGSFPGDLGIEPLEIEDSFASGRIVVDQRHLHPGGYVHGGVWTALGDTVAAWATFRNIPPGHNFTTIELKLNVFSAGLPGDEIVAVATPLHAGKSTVVIEVKVERMREGEEPRLAANLIVSQLSWRRATRRRRREARTGLNALAQRHQILLRERVDHGRAGRARGACSGEGLVEVTRRQRVLPGRGREGCRVEGCRHAWTLGVRTLDQYGPQSKIRCRRHGQRSNRARLPRLRSAAASRARWRSSGPPRRRAAPGTTGWR
jgi:uncharacterized protein (TIGR00369 family)